MNFEEGEDVEEEQHLMKDIITVECQKLNGKIFNGSVNFSKAKIKVVQDGLGLNPGLLGSVKIIHNKCPIITFKLKSKVNVALSINNEIFEFTRSQFDSLALYTIPLTW